MYEIILVLPCKLSSSKRRDLLSRYPRLALRLFRPHNMQDVVLPSEICMNATRASLEDSDEGGDNDEYLGLEFRENEFAPDLSIPAFSRYKNQIKRMKKKGWTNRKIQRWIQERDGHVFRVPVADDPTNDWIDIFRDFLSDRAIEYVGVFYRFFYKRVEVETITHLPRRDLALSKIDDECVRSMEPDTLYIITR